MKSKLIQRLKTLQHEYEAGKQALDDLESKQFNLKGTLLRISGAIQILEELLAEIEEQSDIETPSTSAIDETNTLNADL